MRVVLVVLDHGRVLTRVAILTRARGAHACSHIRARGTADMARYRKRSTSSPPIGRVATRHHAW